MKKNISIIAALVTIIAGGIAIFQFFGAPEPTTDPSSPSPQLSLLERLTGSYSLESWVPANRPIALGIDVIEGTLEVGSDGIFNWSVLITQSSVSNPGKARMTARGKLNKSAMKINGVQGGKYNNTHHLDSRWGQISSSVGLAIRGWRSGESEDPFQVSIDERSNGEILLDMKNSRGTYTWKK